MLIANNSWIVCLRRNRQASMRLFCFPYAGGGASVFRDWVERLPETVEVWSIQYPGRESRINERPFRLLPSLARAICREFESYHGKPFAFYGHSVGGLVGFEVARELRRNNLILPWRLWVSGCSAPHVPDPDPPIHALPEPEFLEKLRAFNGTPAELLEVPEFREVFIPILRADFALRETYAYAPEPPLSCPITVFGGVDDPEVGLNDLEAWREHTSASFDLAMYPGDHFFLHTSKSVLLQRLGMELTRCVENLRDRAYWAATLEVSS